METDNGNVIIPKGSLVLKKGLYLILGSKKIKYNTIKGKILLLYPTSQKVVFLKDTPLKLLPNSTQTLGVVKAGTVADKLYCTKDFKVCYVDTGSLKGVFSENGNIARLEKTDKTLALVGQNYITSTPFGGKKYSTLKGAVVKALYFCPYTNSYYVVYKGREGWVPLKAVKELKFEPIKGFYVVLKDTPLLLSPYSNTEIGSIPAGTFVRPSLKETSTGYWYINYLGLKGFVKPSSLVRVEAIKPTTYWTLKDTDVYLSPGGEKVGIAPKFEKLIGLYTSENGFIYVAKGSFKGWIKADHLTMEKPDFYKPAIFVKKEGDQIRVVVADDKALKRVYVEGDPIDVPKVKDSALLKGKKLAFKPKDVREFTYFLPPVGSSIEIKAVDRSGKETTVRVALTGSGDLAVGGAKAFKKGHFAGIPKLKIWASLLDEDNDKLFEGKEKVTLRLRVENVGTDTAKDVVVLIKNGPALGLPERLFLGDLEPSQSVDKTYTATLPPNVSGKVKLQVEAQTSDGFESNLLDFYVKATPYEPPKFVYDIALKDSNGNMRIDRGELATIYIAIQNVGGDAKNVVAKFNIPKWVKVIEGQRVVSWQKFPKGEVKRVAFQIVVPDKYFHLYRDIPIEVTVKGADTFERETFKVALGKYIKPVEEIALKPKTQAVATLSISSPLLEELKKLPQPKEFRNDALALVIGIENYQELPPSRYSVNDAFAIKEILEKVYRIKTTVLLNSDATFGRIRAELEKLKELAKGKEVIVYYSGHGYPLNNNGFPALVPYDTPKKLAEATLISFQSIMDELKRAGAKKVILLADACYSGYSKGGEALAYGYRPALFMAGRITPPPGGLYASATQEGKSYTDDQLRHGIFTYFVGEALLKGDLNGDGKIEVNELKRYLEKAREYAVQKGYLDQKPLIVPNNINVILSK